MSTFVNSPTYFSIGVDSDQAELKMHPTVRHFNIISANEARLFLSYWKTEGVLLGLLPIGLTLRRKAFLRPPSTFEDSAFQRIVRRVTIIWNTYCLLLVRCWCYKWKHFHGNLVQNGRKKKRKYISNWTLSRNGFHLASWTWTLLIASPSQVVIYLEE